MSDEPTSRVRLPKKSSVTASNDESEDERLDKSGRAKGHEKKIYESKRFTKVVTSPSATVRSLPDSSKRSNK